MSVRQIVQLGQIATISSGGTPSRTKLSYWGGDIPWVKTTQIQNCWIHERDVDEWITEEGLRNSSAKMYPKGTLLMAMYGQGKTRGQVAILGLDATINQACAAIELNAKVADRDFIYHQFLFKYETIRGMSNAGGQDNLSAGIIREIDVHLPPLPEQKAIANTLSTWDTAIETMVQMIAAKEKSIAGKYQRNFSEEGIRSNAWSCVPLCDLFTEITRSVEDKSLKPYSISAGKGFVSQEEKFGRDISGAQYQNYTHLKPGEFAYNKGNSKRFQQGCIYLLMDEEIAVPNAFISFAPKPGKLVAEFYKHYFLGNRHARELRKYISSGARSDGLLNVNTDDFFQIKVPHPPIQTQKALAEAFDLLVTEIELLRQELDLLKLQKRGLMQKLLTGIWRVPFDVTPTKGA